MNEGAQTDLFLPDNVRRTQKRHKRYTALLIVMGFLLGCGTIVFLMSVRWLYADESPNIRNFNSYKCPNTIEEMCVSSGCVKAAAHVLGKMNTSVDPCENFYRFACGGFVKANAIPSDKTEINIFSLINDKLDDQLRRILGESIQDGELKIFKNIKNLYTNCMDKDKIEESGLAVMKDMFVAFGGWPVLRDGNWDEKNFDWKKIMYAYRQNGLSTAHYIALDIAADAGENSKRIIYIEPPNFGLNRDFLMLGKNDKIVKGYYDYMVNMAMLFGADRETATKDMDDVLNFEIALSNATLSSIQKRNISLLYNKLTLREVQDKFPSIPWIDYINSILATGEKVGPEETVCFTEFSYIKALENFIQTTPKSTQANYLIWKVVLTSVSYLTDEAMHAMLQFKKIAQGTKELPPRWKKCVDNVGNAMPNVLGSLYVRKYFDKESKSEILDIMKYIRNEFEDILKTNDWMDARTRQKALDKLHAMAQHIAYPDELLYDKLLTEVYGEINVIPGEYYKSMLNIARFQTDFDYKRLREPVNKTEWISHGATAVVNAFYNHLENSIIFPAGILQGHFFDLDRPRYLNFGAFGSVVGHEITHGFDDIGRQFDKDGNLNEWWEKATIEAFLKKANCMIEQYSNYTVPEVNMTINGKNTQGENIADNGGITESYFAYQRWQKNNRKEPQLPGLNFTPNQMYWLSVAQTWCYQITPEKLRYKLMVDNHSPQEYRVIVPFANLAEFSTDFGCPVGSLMNPQEKCKVW